MSSAASAQPRFSFAAIPSLSGKVALVTGGNAGIGEVCVRALARAGCERVYMASRSEKRANEALERLRSADEQDAAATQKDASTGTGTEAEKQQQAVQSGWSKRIHFVQCDLADLASVKACAEKVAASTDRLDILLCNGGIMAMPYELTKDGIEIQNGTNVVGHALLAYSLLPLLVRTSRLSAYTESQATVRIVLLSSIAHLLFGSADQRWTSLDAVNRKYGIDVYGKWRRYGMSKSGNILLADLLKRQIQGENISVLSLHPGIIDTGLYDSVSSSFGPVGRLFQKVVLKRLFTSVSDGALTSLYACTSPEVDSGSPSQESSGQDQPQKQSPQDRTPNGGGALSGAYLVPLAKVGRKMKHSAPATPEGQAHEGIADRKGGLGTERGEELYAFLKDFFKQHQVHVDIEQLVKDAKAQKQQGEAGQANGQAAH